MTDWTVVTRNKKQKREDGPDLREGGWIQNDREDASQNDNVSDLMKRIPNSGDMYATSGGSFLRRSDELKSCGVRDGSVQVTSRLRGKRRRSKSCNWTTGCAPWRASK